MFEGDMPARAVKMVKVWAKKYNRDLMDMWKTQKYRQLPGLE
jgi:TolB-like protein